VNSNNNAAFQDSSVGDMHGSFRASQNTNLIGNPGTYSVPEPMSATAVFVLAAAATLTRRRRIHN
jgi:hypothetical protein